MNYLCRREFWPSLYGRMVANRIFGCAVYDITPASAEGIELSGIWSAFQSIENSAAYQKIDEGLRQTVSECLRVGQSRIFRYPRAPINERGERWWDFVIASGPAKGAGLVICGHIAAECESAVMAAIEDVQTLFDETVEREKGRDKKTGQP